MPRFFTLAEAERLLPEVEAILRNLLTLKRNYEAQDAELTGLLQKIAVSGGTIPPRDRISELRKQKDIAARSLQSALAQLEETGCLLKDVDTGLIDFPTWYQGHEVYLCWKLGESGIGFWHPVADGFRGRRAIDSEFLASHTNQQQKQ